MKEITCILWANVFSRWSFRYIKKMVEEGNVDLTVIDYFEPEKNSDSQIALWKSQVEYCNCHGITVIAHDPLSWSEVDKIEEVLKVKEIEQFDICHIMFPADEVVSWAMILRDRWKKLVLNFWGSDVFRVDQKEIEEQKKLLEITDVVLVSSKNLLEQFPKQYPEFKGPVHKVQFENPMWQLLCSDNTYDEQFPKEIDTDKILVSVCHSGVPAHQHEKIIQLMQKCNENVKKQLFFCFFMTYNTDGDYVKHIEEVAEKSGLSYIILKDYLSDEAVVALRKKMGIYINFPTTDSLTAAQMESLYCGTVTIRGDWLKYPELDDLGLFYLSAKDNEIDLTKKIEQVVENYDFYREKSKINRDIVETFLEKKEGVEDWVKYYTDEFPVRGDEHQKKIISEAVLFDAFMKRNNDLKKVDLYYSVVLDWLKMKIKGVNAIDYYLKEKGIQKICLYGLGEMGEMVYHELAEQGYEIVLCDGKEREAKFSSLPVVEPNEIASTGVECILITPIFAYNEIKESLEKILCDTKNICIVGLREMILDVRDMGL